VKAGFYLKINQPIHIKTSEKKLVLEIHNNLYPTDRIKTIDLIDGKQQYTVIYSMYSIDNSYYELYFTNEDGEKIILSSGYTGKAP